MGKRYELMVDLQTGADLKIQSSVLLSMVIRSIRELLFNVVKHAGTKHAVVDARADRDRIRITVMDTGRGCDLNMLKNKQNTGDVFGLFDIEDRIKFIGGHLQIESKPGRGFSVTLNVPTDVTLPAKKVQTVMP